MVVITCGKMDRLEQNAALTYFK